jgi:hypothetical protein
VFDLFISPALELEDSWRWIWCQEGRDGSRRVWRGEEKFLTTPPPLNWCIYKFFLFQYQSQMSHGLLFSCSSITIWNGEAPYQLCWVRCHTCLVPYPT